MRGLIYDTYLEMRDRKIIWVFGVVVGLVLLAIAATNDIEAKFQFQQNGNVDASELNDMFGNPILTGFSVLIPILIFLSIMGSAGIIPKLIEKGRAEYFFSKPITRQSLLFSKMFGIWIVYGGMVLAATFILYLAIGLFHGIYETSVLQLAGLSLVSVFLWQVISTFFGVLSGSTGTVMMTLFLIWVAEKILDAREIFKQLIDSRAVDFIVDAFYYLVPKMAAVADTFFTLAAGKEVTDWVPLWSTALVALSLLFLTRTLISKRDF